MPRQKRKLTLDLVKKRVDKLPILPAVVCELLSLNTSSPTCFEQVLSLSKRSPSLTAKILRLANSAKISPLNNVNNLHQAIVRIGIDRIIAISTMTSVLKVFIPSTPEQKDIWRHSILTAYLAEYIAQNTKKFSVEKDFAYTCGLLHDIGRLILFEISKNATNAIDAKGWDTPIELPEVEKKLLGFTHADVGELSAIKWGLPHSIVNVIKYHHDYDLTKLPSLPKDADMIRVVQLADHISIFLVKHLWSDWEKEYFEQQLTEHCTAKLPSIIDISEANLINEIPIIVSKCESEMKKLLLS